MHSSSSTADEHCSQSSHFITQSFCLSVGLSVGLCLLCFTRIDSFTHSLICRRPINTMLYTVVHRPAHRASRRRTQVRFPRNFLIANVTSKSLTCNEDATRTLRGSYELETAAVEFSLDGCIRRVTTRQYETNK